MPDDPLCMLLMYFFNMAMPLLNDPFSITVNFKFSR